ncbi:hypothetical protein X743_28620 [Mesorhizobium sp. LNHC252B00]|nr:hypothetical protein [Mesorhizobium sp. LNHC252B00]ESY66390.1 hypothetical protein X743_28620 [Mesorhizobium sp. LNHC252B00]
MAGNRIHHLALALDFAFRARHAAANDDAALLFEDLRPDEEVGDMR